MSRPAQVGDTRIRWSLGPPLGWAISYACGLLGNAGWQQPRYWFGVLYFSLVSLMLWKGNVLIWFWLRGRPDWVVDARRRLLLIAGAVLAFTVPTSVLLISGWFLVTGRAIDWPLLWRATVLITLVSAFIFHIYETIDLISQRARERSARQQLEYAKALAELSALRAQIDPHFMFNCLNTLAGLIEAAPANALRFTVTLGSVYRYILQSRTRELVPLEEELAFLSSYHGLLQLRFEDAIVISLPTPAPGAWIAPVSLQLLLENAVKHNEFSSASPLRIDLEIAGDTISLRHAKRPSKPRSASGGTGGTGLETLDKRCRLILQRGIAVSETPEFFAVTLPLRIVY